MIHNHHICIYVKLQTADEAAKKTYEFWSTQPVRQIDEEINTSTNEAIAPNVPYEALRHDPYSLPDGFHWDTLNLDDPLVVSKKVLKHTLSNELQA